MIKLSKTTVSELWGLVISTDYDYSRICIAEHELTDEHLILWLEDKYDFKNSLDECVQVEITHRQFAKVISSENLNSYEAVNAHPTKGFDFKEQKQINTPINWYRDDSTLTGQLWAREAMLKQLLTSLVEREITV